MEKRETLASNLCWLSSDFSFSPTRGAKFFQVFLLPRAISLLVI
jgi:hypothetical protein